MFWECVRRGSWRRRLKAEHASVIVTNACHDLLERESAPMRKQAWGASIVVRHCGDEVRVGHQQTAHLEQIWQVRQQKPPPIHVLMSFDRYQRSPFRTGASTAKLSQGLARLHSGQARLIVEIRLSSTCLRLCLSCAKKGPLKQVCVVRKNNWPIPGSAAMLLNNKSRCACPPAVHTGDHRMTMSASSRATIACFTDGNSTTNWMRR